ncbi:uncharacterized protein LOC132559137 [Ylistrum balloti]|uniref:uncharacterized protein LOC132559137 n=1 Tax=Ylistrum balloti TaxID=509963 RepID=UPI0029059ECF|nr:uncharacterized protein LOC132559137 [Ylistrum balloti]
MLSRLEYSNSDDDPEGVMEQSTIKAVCSSIQTRARAEVVTSDSLIDLDDLDNGVMENMTQRQWGSMQAQDRVLRPMITAIRDARKPHRRNLSLEQSKLLRYFDSLVLDQGVLCRDSKRNGECVRQRVLPSVLVNKVLHYFHDCVGHPGRDRTLSLIQDRFFWPGMTKDVDKWLQKCPR